MAKEKTYTPMMQHYLSVKEQYPDALVFYRIGDFYEMFFEDAKIASKELDLILTGKSAGVEERVPMCGVPHHAVQSYLQRLVSRGYKIAIVEQMQDRASESDISLLRRCTDLLHPPTLWRPASVVRNRRHVADQVDTQSGTL